MRIQKRDGTFELFSVEKLRRSLLAAFDTASVVTAVMPIVYRIADKTISSTDALAEIVERELSSSGFHPVAKAYIIYRNDKRAGRILRPDNSALADYIHVAKYARWSDALGRREVWSESVDRVLNMHLERFAYMGADFGNEIVHAFQPVYRKEVLPSMRSLQFGGAALLRDNARMYNCSFTLVDRASVWREIFYLLLCGCGVGASVQWRHTNRLPVVPRLTRGVLHWHVEDTIQGWAMAVDTLMNESQVVEFDYSAIRAEGSPLLCSGGIAPGHLPLKATLENIRQVITPARGRMLRPIECADIICYMAEAVLSGGIRRSSLIIIFDPSDTEMMYCKTAGVFAFGGLNNQRAMSNNSARLSRGCERAVFDRLISLAESNYGDPGFFFNDNPDVGTNPCGEIGLDPVSPTGETGFSFCNLCEVNVTTASFLEACRAAAFIGTLQACYSSFPFLSSTTEEICARDRLLGVGLMGLADREVGAEEMRAGSLACVSENARVAEMLGIAPAARVTTVKPGGTAPKLASVGSGIHPHHAHRTFMGITANALEPAARYFRAINPHMVTTKGSGDLFITFPVEVSASAVTTKTQPALSLCSRVISVYENWVLPGTRRVTGLTHNVSCTITMKPEERDSVIAFVWANRDKIAAMAFAPFMLDKQVPFIPREECTPDDYVRWNRLIENYKKVDWTKFKEKSVGFEIECAGRSCAI